MPKPIHSAVLAGMLSLSVTLAVSSAQAATATQDIHAEHATHQHEHAVWRAQHMQSLATLRQAESVIYRHEAMILQHEAAIAQHDDAMQHGHDDGHQAHDAMRETHVHGTAEHAEMMQAIEALQAALDKLHK